MRSVWIPLALVVSGCGVFLPGVWYDEENELLWENPPPRGTRYWDEAITYCESLSLYDRDDWHLPTIDELRSLMRDCDNSCAVSTTCSDWSGCASGCTDGCALGRGPGEDGCYWPEVLTGECGGALEKHWSSTRVTDEDHDAWLVDFAFGSIWDEDYESNENLVRCVATGL